VFIGDERRYAMHVWPEIERMPVVSACGVEAVEERGQLDEIVHDVGAWWCPSGALGVEMNGMETCIESTLNVGTQAVADVHGAFRPRTRLLQGGGEQAAVWLAEAATERQAHDIERLVETESGQHVE